MSETSTYTFLPWLREGIANQISGQSGQSGLRTTIPVHLTISGDSVTEEEAPDTIITRDIEIYGPGDITGIDPRAIVRTEPRNWITNFEPNYLPLIEFYDEDLPWRYSPLTESGNRLMPWIALIVLKTDEFTEGRNIQDRPLPYIGLTSAARLTPSDQLWAWAHVHVNKSLIGESIISEEGADIAAKLGTVLRENPDMAYSRLVCPRRLEDKTDYEAFLIPVFESGRLAGLGLDFPDTLAFDTLAWTDTIIPPELPYYYRWHFATGSVGDFEYLVRLLEPKPADSRVGLRDIDVQQPGANIRGIIDEDELPDNKKLDGILKLGGALRIPDISYSPEEFPVIEKYRSWATVNGDYPHPFQSDLAAFINLSDTYEEKQAEEANSNAGITEVQSAEDRDVEYDISNNLDPVITAPLYGRWHSLTQRLLKEMDGEDITPNKNWVHELNLDPRWRVAAGFGTKIVQENQEEYMKSAWEQVGDILEANRLIREAQLSREVNFSWYANYLKPIMETAPEKWVALSAPVHRKVLSKGFTISHQVKESAVPQVMLSVPMRKTMRPGSTLVRRIQFDQENAPTNLIHRVNEGEVSAAPARKTPANINTLEDIVRALEPAGLPAFLIDLLRESPQVKWIPVGLAVLILVLLVVFAPGAVVGAAGAAAIAGSIYAYTRFNKWAEEIVQADAILIENQTPEAVDRLSSSPDFRISEPGEGFTPTFDTTDSEEAVRFKQALKDVSFVLQESARIAFTPDKPELNIATVNDVTLQALDPEITIPLWTGSRLSIPGNILNRLRERFEEVMAYPRLDLPMYKPLADHSAELFLPNINFIAENSITLLETNQKFIEAYMVGLNHEFSRELLWREYPTDQRGSYFRQFWEARSFFAEKNIDPEELKEQLRDIPPIHLWSKYSDLGDHDHRDTGEDKEEVVLTIRGELLKRYPNAVIYAHRAVWKDTSSPGEPIIDLNSGQVIDPSKERDLMPLPADLEENPPEQIIRSPLYEAKVEPDIYFFGFDLTTCQAKGGTGVEDEEVDEKCREEGINWDDPGWFFVIKERPGEPKFGLDVGSGTGELEQPKVWNDLSWDHLSPAVAEGGFIQMTDSLPPIPLDPLDPLDDSETEKQDQKNEDNNIEWNAEMNAADLAYILYQVPVLVAVHAVEMLPRDGVTE